MRIDTGTQSTVSSVSSVNHAGSVNRTQAVKGSQAVQSAFQVQLTNLLAEVQPSSGAVRPDKVAEISNKLSEGNYSISGQDVASKLLLTIKA